MHKTSSVIFKSIFHTFLSLGSLGASMTPLLAAASGRRPARSTRSSKSASAVKPDLFKRRSAKSFRLSSKESGYFRGTGFRFQAECFGTGELKKTQGTDKYGFSIQDSGISIRGGAAFSERIRRLDYLQFQALAGSCSKWAPEALARTGAWPTIFGGAYQRRWFDKNKGGGYAAGAQMTFDFHTPYSFASGSYFPCIWAGGNANVSGESWKISLEANLGLSGARKFDKATWTGIVSQDAYFKEWKEAASDDKVWKDADAGGVWISPASQLKVGTELWVGRLFSLPKLYALSVHMGGRAATKALDETFVIPFRAALGKKEYNNFQTKLQSLKAQQAQNAQNAQSSQNSNSDVETASAPFGFYKGFSVRFCQLFELRVVLDSFLFSPDDTVGIAWVAKKVCSGLVTISLSPIYRTDQTLGEQLKFFSETGLKAGKLFPMSRVELDSFIDLRDRSLSIGWSQKDS